MLVNLELAILKSHQKQLLQILITIFSMIILTSKHFREGLAFKCVKGTLFTYLKGTSFSRSHGSKLAGIGHIEKPSETFRNGNSL